jgi:hypothetical protein
LTQVWLNVRTLTRFLLLATVLLPIVACGGDDSITPAPPAPIVGAITGTVAVEGTGVAGLTLQLGGEASAATTTGADGSFAFPDVLAGQYTLTLSGIPADYSFTGTTQAVTITTSGQVAGVDFNGSWVRTASVLVSVARADGTPEVTNVRLSSADEQYDQTLSTDAAGTITFRGLKMGDYTVSLPDSPEGFSQTSESVSVQTGQAAQINFTGDRELLPPTITVASVVQAGDDQDREELSDIDEDVLVYLDVNPNGNRLTSVEFWALEKRTGDVYRVGTQRFGVAVDGPELVDGIYRAEFYFNQYDFIRRRDGSHPTIEMLGAEGFEAIGPDAMRPYHPVFVDGDYEFHGVVTVAEFPGETFNAIADVTLTEGQDCCSDRAILRVEADNSGTPDISLLPEGEVITPETPLDDYAPFPSVLLDDDGYRWHSGDILVQAYPVIYSAPSNPNDPLLARMTLALDNADEVENDEPNDDGSFSFKFCEWGDDPNTPETGDCDEDYSDVLDDDVRASISTITRFGQQGTNIVEYWFEDLYSGTEDNLRVDNQAPAPGTMAPDNLPHPANAIAGVTGFSRTATEIDCVGAPAMICVEDLPLEVPFALSPYTGWLNWGDDLGDLVVDPDEDADGDGIGMAGDDDGLFRLVYVYGPDLADFSSFTVSSDAPATESGSQRIGRGIFNVEAEPMITAAFNTYSTRDVPPETDSPGLVDAGSAANTPLSDTEFDYGTFAAHFDRFGNAITTLDEPGEGVASAYFGVDGFAPSFTDEDGDLEDPADPTERTSVYNTYDSGFFRPGDVRLDGEYFGDEVFESFLDGADDPIEGEYFGWTTDTGNGFSGVEGVVIEDWAYAGGTVAGTSRFGYALATTGLMSWTFNADVELSNDFTISAYAEWTEGSDDGNAYRDQRVHSFDRAGNQRIVDNVTEHIVDQSNPVVESPSRPAGTLEWGESYTFSALAVDDVDLKKSDVSLVFSGLFEVDVRDGSPSTSTSADLFFLPLFFGVAYPIPELDGEIWLPVGNFSHTEFGSEQIEAEASLSASVPLNVCGVAFRGSMLGSIGFQVATTVGFRTWDHASPYGLVDRNSVDIEDVLPSEGGACEAEGDIGDKVASFVDHEWAWDFETNDDGRPVISQVGPTSTFSPMAGMDEISLYYVDVAGRLILVDTEPSDWSLNVSDTGGSESDARRYAYTYTGEMPTDRISDEVIAEALPGTVDGFTFIWVPEDEAIPGAFFLWNSLVGEITVFDGEATPFE